MGTFCDPRLISTIKSHFPKNLSKQIIQDKPSNKYIQTKQKLSVKLVVEVFRNSSVRKVCPLHSLHHELVLNYPVTSITTHCVKPFRHLHTNCFRVQSNAEFKIQRSPPRVQSERSEQQWLWWIIRLCQVKTIMCRNKCELIIINLYHFAYGFTDFRAFQVFFSIICKTPIFQNGEKGECCITSQTNEFTEMVIN